MGVAPGAVHGGQPAEALGLDIHFLGNDIDAVIDKLLPAFPVV